jgi:ubiquinone/menaquinone biosynthesis C-methylase UbiE
VDRKAHWEQVYTTKARAEVSWFQAEPARSLALVREAAAGRPVSIIDIGGGDSSLVDGVVSEGLGQMTVLDISGAALARARARLGARASEVRWIEADVTRADLADGSLDIWHDRAVFHFLTDAADRARYVALAARALRSGSTMLVFTFALDGPSRCSALDVMQYSPESLARELGEAFTLVEGMAESHRTPSGAEQRFTVAVLRRR